MSTTHSTSRRSLLKAGLVVSSTGLLMTAACTSPPPPPPPAAPSPEVTDKFQDLERRHGARLGVYGQNTRTGQTVSYRGGERFALCSVLKGPLVAHVLRDYDRAGEYLARVIHYTKADMIDESPVTENYVDTGMAIRDLCAAAIIYSDNTACNLLLRETGGPPALTKFLRSIGDQYTRLDRIEPDMSTATPGDPRDTTTPEAIARSYQQFVLGDALGPRDRDQLTAWLKSTATSGNRFRAGLPTDWVIADKTGTGGYGTANDIGIAWTTQSTPLVLAVMTTHNTNKDAAGDEKLIAEATRLLHQTIAPQE